MTLSIQISLQCTLSEIFSNVMGGDTEIQTSGFVYLG